MDITELLCTMNAQQLLNLKSMIDDQIEAAYDLPENFYLHETLDDYLYIVKYDDGSSHLYIKGAQAYREYKANRCAVGIIRKTKDLFPVFELMLVKENHERKQEELRQELCYETLQKNYSSAEQRKRCRHNYVS